MRSCCIWNWGKFGLVWNAVALSLSLYLSLSLHLSWFYLSLTVFPLPPSPSLSLSLCLSHPGACMLLCLSLSVCVSVCLCVPLSLSTPPCLHLSHLTFACHMMFYDWEDARMPHDVLRLGGALNAPRLIGRSAQPSNMRQVLVTCGSPMPRASSSERHLLHAFATMSSHSSYPYSQSYRDAL